MARYYAEQALGMLETVGMVPALEACDKMLKAAEVELISYENVGSTLVTMFIKGDVAAVKSSIKAGAEAAEAIGKLTATDVIPRPIKPIGDVVSIYDVDTQCDEEIANGNVGRTEALGMIETFGIVYAIEAADAMCKAADVELIGFENTASGYISVLTEGDVGACKTAVEAGIKAVENLGTEVYSSVVIARPHEGLKKITSQYDMEKLLPYGIG
ncbi:MAG: BMC domain-containing protein [Firmicutes bacterium]|nr:BMC domain-containing protein [Bacillota bacterium]NBI63006.1 BMC domain-containing protein [Clostridiales bacterium]